MRSGCPEAVENSNRNRLVKRGLHPNEHVADFGDVTNGDARPFAIDIERGLPVTGFSCNEPGNN